MSEVEGSFAEHPRSLSEVRAERSGSAGDLTPRDVLIRALRDIDAGAVEADHVIVAIGSTSPAVSRTVFYHGGSFAFHAQLGLLSRVAGILPEKG